MPTLFESPEYQKTQELFPMQQTQQQLQTNPLIMELKKMQDQARAKAFTAVNNQMYSTGFGRSTFAPMFAGQAGVQAAAPYTGQIAQTGENLNQQAFQKFAQMLGMGEQRRGSDIQQSQFGQQLDLQRQMFQQKLDEDKRKRESDFWNNLLGAGLTGLTYAINPAAGFMNQFSKMMSTPGEGTSGYLPRYKPNYLR